jgi:hypothetical protein
MKEFYFSTIVCWLVVIDYCLSCKKLTALLFARFVGECNLQDRREDEDELGTDIEEEEGYTHCGK